MLLLDYGKCMLALCWRFVLFSDGADAVGGGSFWWRGEKADDCKTKRASSTIRLVLSRRFSADFGSDCAPIKKSALQKRNRSGKYLQIPLEIQVFISRIASIVKVFST